MEIKRNWLSDVMRGYERILAEDVVLQLNKKNLLQPINKINEC